MLDKQSDFLIVGIVVLYTVYACTVAFQLHLTMWQPSMLPMSSMRSMRSMRSIRHASHSFLAHDEVHHSSGGVGMNMFRGGVCTLGKLGAWALIVWGLVMSIVLLSNEHGDNEEKRKSRYKILAIINMSFLGVYFLLTLLMNTPLFLRSLPYFVAQFFVSKWLLQKSK